MPYSACKKCGAKIRWANTLNGKKIPLDARPNGEGNLNLVGETVYRVTENFKRVHPDEVIYMTHFATCAGR